LRSELAMIDENLMRAELTPADRAAQTARRKAIYLELHPETAHGAVGRGGYDENSGQVVRSFSAATSEATGKDERTVRRDAERGEKICSEALTLVRGTELDTGTYLDKLKKLPVEEQLGTAQRALSGIARREVKAREDEQEARNKARVEADIKARAAAEIAEILAEHVPGELWDALKANLGVTTSQKILSAFTNLVGHSITEAA
jgi:vacuolar-type H+-ATPase subunit I/STV1